MCRSCTNGTKRSTDDVDNLSDAQVQELIVHCSTMCREHTRFYSDAGVQEICLEVVPTVEKRSTRYR